jgi:hypothetical protein
MAELRVTELDFDDIKQNLKTYLQSQDEFNSYNFEGSGMNVLLNLLAYNTHYNAYLANMIHNEAFLDSAIKRASVVSKAKHLSYVPRSTTAAKAVVDILVNSPTGSPNTLTLNRFTTFTSNVGGSSFTFSNINDVTISPINGQYIFEDVVLYEGTPLTFTYAVSEVGPTVKYEIPNANVDTTTILVTVQNSSSDLTTTVFTKVTDITSVTPTSNVYYLEENYNGRYEIYFGDNILGKQLSAGNIIRIEYLITNGEAANIFDGVTQTFSLNGSIGGSSSVLVTVIQVSAGGAEAETIDQIKFNAPRNFVSQNRAVTAEDYANIIRQNFAGVESITVWGGEDNDPPIYGKVFISLKPFEGTVISETQKAQIKTDILASRGVVSVIPEFVDPIYTYVGVNANVRYDAKVTTKSTSQIVELVRAAIEGFFTNNLQQFDRNLVYSRLAASIDAADPSIYGNSFSLKLQKRIKPTLNLGQSWEIRFNTRVHPGDVESTRFFTSINGLLVAVRLADSPNDMPPNYDGSGTMFLINADTNENLLSVGTVNYATGSMTINNLVVTGFQQNQTDIRITVSQQEDSMNVDVINNEILILDDSTGNRLINRNAGVFISVTPI